MKDDLVVRGDETLYYTRKDLRVLRPWVGAGAFALVLVFLWFDPSSSAQRFVALVPLLVVGVIYLAWRLPQALSPRPILVLDKTGFTDRTTWAGLGRVAWADVAGLRLVSKGRFSGIEVQVRDASAFSASLPWSIRWSLKMNGWWGFPEFFVPVIALSESPEKVLERMEAHRAGKQELRPVLDK